MHGGLEDTICAVATPIGEGGIGIVRLSGPQAIVVASQVVRLRSGQPLLIDFFTYTASGRSCDSRIG